MMFRKDRVLSFLVNRIALAILLSIFLLVPIFFGGRFADSLKDLPWLNMSDVFVLTWSSGMMSLFISVVFVELFRQSLRSSYLYLSLLFFSFGSCELLYSFFSLNFKDAMWFKASGALVSGFILAAAVFFFKKYSHEYFFSLLKNFLIVLMITSFFAFLPFSGLKGLLPAYGPLGALTFPVLSFFYAASLLFIGGALPWLNSYLQQPVRENLVIGLFLVCIGQLFVLVGFLIHSSFFWWLWHLAFLLLLLGLALYLVIACLKRSFIWKIVLSISLLFSLTMLASFWAVGKYYENREREMLVEIIYANLSSKHERYLEKFKAADELFSSISEKIDSPKTEPDRIPMMEFIGIHAKNLCRSRYDNLCFISADGSAYIFSEDTMPESLNRKIHDMHFSAKPGEGSFGMVEIEYPDTNARRKFILFFRKFNNNASVSVIYDAVFVLSRPLIRQYPELEVEWGKIIFDTRSGKIVYAKHPSSLLKMTEKMEDKFIPSIVSLAHKARKKKHKMATEISPSERCMFFGSLEPFSRWLIIDYSYGEFVSGRTALYVHTVAAMSSMLIGLVVMLIMMNKLLNHPMKKLMNAAFSLQSGNFDYRTKTRREDEIGTLEHVFDQTAERLKILYNNLKMTIVEKDEALVKIRKIEKEKRDFFNALSHELKSPIHSIINFSRFGMSSSMSGIREYFEKIHECSILLLNIIEELLQIAQLDSLPKKGADLFSMKESVNESVWKLSAQVREKKLQIKTDFSPETDEFAIFADKKQIDILLSNIIGNAVKYTADNSAVSILCEKKDEHYTIKVSDQGPGIADEDMDKLFHEFTRLSKSKEKGSGLGLYVSKKIVKMHDGTIYAANNSEKGVSFFITLPVRNEKKE